MSDDHVDVLVIGAGLASLTGAALLAKRGLRVLCVEQHTQPGGSCGAFRLNGRTVDQGTSMFFGFGVDGFNPHRHVMNLLEEPIEVIRHPVMYRLVYGGHPIDFDADIDAYLDSLRILFDFDVDGIKKFYEYIADLYYHVIAADTTYMSPTEVPVGEAMARFIRHPVRNMRLLPLLRKSAGDLLRRFVDSEEVVRFFSKLTSTYCYTTLDETPAILAITMFMENHVGGTYYAAGGSHQLPGKLERAFEKLGGTIRYRTKAVQVLFKDGLPHGAVLEHDGDRYEVVADRILYGGTLLNLHGNLLENSDRKRGKLEQVKALAMTYPSVVLYCIVDRDALPPGTLPIEMLADNIEALDEKEVTMYAFSLSDPSICAADEHVVMAIGPSLRIWPKLSEAEAYRKGKKAETKRLLNILDAHFPGFSSHVREVRLATPTTIERFTMKEYGHVAGPKQAMGQELLNRQRARGDWRTLYHCGEATVMGTGSPAVTISGISAANLILRDIGLDEYRSNASIIDMVTVHDTLMPEVRTTVDGRRLPSTNAISNPLGLRLHDEASACQWCLDAPCATVCPVNHEIPAIMRRLECGNPGGARKQVVRTETSSTLTCLACPAPCMDVCTVRKLYGKPVAIKETLTTLWDAPEGIE